VITWKILTGNHHLGNNTVFFSLSFKFPHHRCNTFPFVIKVLLNVSNVIGFPCAHGKKQNIVVHDIKINDASRWAGSHEEVSLLTWVGQNLWEYSMPYYGIFMVYLFSTWKFSNDMAKYLMTCHGIFCHVTKVFFGINKRLLTLNMGLVNKAFECNFMWRFEDKRK
jgi:hypothetical protein